jgi:hypothetical protein
VDRLYITVPYMNFYGFWKTQIFNQNPYVLAYGFSENCLFGALNLLISWSWPPYAGSVIHNCHINELLRVLKNSNFCSKSIGVSLRFYRKSPVWGKNWPKLSISWSWPHITDHLYITVSYMSFYGFWKNSCFCSKSIGVSLRF